MSIILNALKNQEKDKLEKVEPIEEPIFEGEGFFRGKESFIKKAPSAGFSLEGFRLKRVHVLAVIFVVIVAGVLGLWLWKGSDETRMIPTGYESVKPTENEVASKNTEDNTSVSATPVSVAPSGSSPAETVEVGKIIADANAAYEAGDYDKGAALFKQAIEAKPDDAYLHNSLGLIYQQKELYSNASAEFQKALELDGACFECFNNFGLLKSVLGETVEAQKYLEKAINLNTTYPDPYFNLAVLYEKAGDLGNAVKYYRQFTAVYPNQQDEIVIKVRGRINELTGQ